MSGVPDRPAPRLTEGGEPVYRDVAREEQESVAVARGIVVATIACLAFFGIAAVSVVYLFGLLG